MAEVKHIYNENHHHDYGDFNWNETVNRHEHIHEHKQSNANNNHGGSFTGGNVHLINNNSGSIATVVSAVVAVLIGSVAIAIGATSLAVAAIAVASIMAAYGITKSLIHLIAPVIRYKNSERQRDHEIRLLELQHEYRIEEQKLELASQLLLSNVSRNQIPAPTENLVIELIYGSQTSTPIYTLSNGE